MHEASVRIVFLGHLLGRVVPLDWLKSGQSLVEEVETAVGQLPPMGIHIVPSENMLLLSGAHSGNVCTVQST